MRQGLHGYAQEATIDLYRQAAVATRVKLTEHQRKLLKELDASFIKKGRHKHSPNDKGWFEKAKDFFS